MDVPINNTKRTNPCFLLSSPALAHRPVNAVIRANNQIQSFGSYGIDEVHVSAHFICVVSGTRDYWFDPQSNDAPIQAYAYTNFHVGDNNDVFCYEEVREHGSVVLYNGSNRTATFQNVLTWRIRDNQLCLARRVDDRNLMIAWFDCATGQETSRYTVPDKTDATIHLVNNRFFLFAWDAVGRTHRIYELFPDRSEHRTTFSENTTRQMSFMVVDLHNGTAYICCQNFDHGVHNTDYIWDMTVLRALSRTLSILATYDHWVLTRVGSVYDTTTNGEQAVQSVERPRGARNELAIVNQRVINWTTGETIRELENARDAYFIDDQILVRYVDRQTELIKIVDLPTLIDWPNSHPLALFLGMRDVIHTTESFVSNNLGVYKFY